MRKNSILCWGIGQGTKERVDGSGGKSHGYRGKDQVSDLMSPFNKRAVSILFCSTTK